MLTYLSTVLLYQKNVFHRFSEFIKLLPLKSNPKQIFCEIANEIRCDYIKIEYLHCSEKTLKLEKIKLVFIGPSLSPRRK